MFLGALPLVNHGTSVHLPVTICPLPTATSHKRVCVDYTHSWPFLVGVCARVCCFPAQRKNNGANEVRADGVTGTGHT